MSRKKLRDEPGLRCFVGYAINQRSFRGRTRGNAVPIVEVFKNALWTALRTIFRPNCSTIDCRILHIQSQIFFPRGDTPGPRRSAPGAWVAWIQTPISAWLDFTKRPLGSNGFRCLRRDESTWQSVIVDDQRNSSSSVPFSANHPACPRRDAEPHRCRQRRRRHGGTVSKSRPSVGQPGRWVPGGD